MITPIKNKITQIETSSGNHRCNLPVLCTGLCHQVIAGFFSNNYLLFIFIILFFPCKAYSATDSISLTTYYPAPLGSYDTFRLIPRTTNYSGSCNPGTIYVNSSTQLQFCNSSGAWEALGGSGLWVAGANQSIYLNNSYNKVGIGTQTPEFKLNLIGAGSIIATGAATDPLLQTSGAGTRLIWYTKKAAFRAGAVDETLRADLTTHATDWDEANIGMYSAAFNHNTKASGTAATAMGEGTTASNNYAFSQGKDTVASGQASVAMGDTSTASGTTSFAVGDHAVVSQPNAVAMGYYPQANGANSIALSNYDAEANASYSMAFGNQITVTGNNSIGFGLGAAATVSQPNTLAIMGGKVGIHTSPAYSLTVADDGGILAYPTNGNAFGTAPVLPALPTGRKLFWYPRKAAFRAGYVTGNKWDDANIGNYSMAGGYDTLATGSASMAFGYNTTASGNNSVAFGQGTIAQGLCSTAMGLNAQATGQYSTALGNGSQATNDTAIAMGKNAKATGIRSFAIGEGITVSGTDSVGMSLSSTLNTVSQNNTLAIVGTNVKVGIGAYAPTQTLAIGTLSWYGLAGANYLTIDNTTDGNVGRSSDTYIPTPSSSRRYKKDIKPLQDDFYKILKVEPKSFVFKANNEPDIGVIAEEIDELGLKNLVIYSKEGKPEGVKYEKTPLYLLMIMKDQEQKLQQIQAILCKDQPNAELCK